MKNFELFRLEDRVLFDAAGAVEVVEAAEAAENVTEQNAAEQQQQDDKNAVKNAPAENPADQAAQDTGKALADPSEVADIDAQIEQLIQGGISANDIDVDVPVVTDVFDGQPDMVDAVVNDSGEVISTDRELVVINGTVPDKDAILAELKPHQDVLILEDGNGLDKLNEFLDNRDTKYSAIHLVTHGSEGYLYVNGEKVDAENFNADEWADVGGHLTDDGDILLYGCNTAESEAGKLLVDKIADASGADVAASTDATGIHGDWDLEYAVGNIETAEISVEGFRYVLAGDYTVTSNADIDDTTANTLRYALAQGSTNITFEIDGSDTITINRELVIGSVYDNNALVIDGTNLGSGADGIDNNSTITIKVQEVGRVQNADGTWSDNANASNYRVFRAETSSDESSNWDLTLKNMTILGGSVADDDNDGNGGAIFVQGANAALALNHVTLSGSKASGNGGGIFCETYGHYTNVTIEGSTFSGNSAQGSGGGIYAANFGYGTDASVTVTITDSTISGNSAGNNGGGISCYSFNLSTLKVADSNISGNSVSNGSGYGGGIYCSGTTSNTVMLLNSIVLGNRDSFGVSDLSFAGNTNTFNAAYSIYGVSNIAPSAASTGNVTNATVESVFGENALKDGIIAILNTGEAAYSGTLVGKVGDISYYYNQSTGKWTNFSNDITYTFDATNTTTYGLPDGMVYTTSQNNLSRTRLLADTGVAEFAVGAAVQETIYVKAQQADTSYTYDGNGRSSDIAYTTAGGKTIAASLVSGVLAGMTSSKNAGDYTVNATVGVDATVNNQNYYDIKAGSDATITINKKAVTATSPVLIGSREYNGTNIADDKGDGELFDVITGEDVTLNVQYTYEDKNVGDDKRITASTWELAGADSANYFLATAKPYDVSGSITAKAITVTVTDQGNVIYGDANPTPGYTTDTELSAGDSFTGALRITGDKSSSGYYTAGDHNITQGTLAISDGNNGKNYELTFVGDSFTVARLLLTHNVGVTTNKVYDGTTSVAHSGGLTNVVNGDTVVFDVAFDYNSKNVAEAKTISATTWGISGADAANYSLPVLTMKINGKITQRELTITANVQTVTYGDNADFKDYSIINWAPDEAQSDIGSMGLDNSSRSGAGKLQVGQAYNFTGDGLDAGRNYMITFNSAAVTVNKLALTNDVNVRAEKIYDGTTAAESSGGLTNVITGDSVTLSKAFDFNSKDVAEANSISATTWEISGADAGNYNLNGFSPIEGRIAKKAVTATSPVLIGSREYNGTNIADDKGDGELFDVITGEDVTLNVHDKVAMTSFGRLPVVNYVSDAKRKDFLWRTVKKISCGGK